MADKPVAHKVDKRKVDDRAVAAGAVGNALEWYDFAALTLKAAPR